MQVRRAVLDKKTGQIAGEEDACVDRDECNRPDTTIEGLRKLPAVFDTKSGHGSVTAGNSSQLSDGASATLVMSSERAVALGITPRLIFRGYAGNDENYSRETEYVLKGSRVASEHPKIFFRQPGIVGANVTVEGL